MIRSGPGGILSWWRGGMLPGGRALRRARRRAGAGRSASGADDGTPDDGGGDDGGQEPEGQGGQPVPQRQVRPVVDVERGEHGGVGDAHPGDVAGVAGAVAAPVQVSDGGGGKGHRAEDEQVVVLGPAHGGQAGGRAGDDGGQAGEDVDGEDGQEGGGGGAHLVAQDAAGGGHRLLPSRAASA